jgi:hypothetical protein
LRKTEELSAATWSTIKQVVTIQQNEEHWIFIQVNTVTITENFRN